MYAFLNVLLKRVLGKLKSVSNYCESHFWKASRFVFWRAFYRDGRAFRNGRFSRTSQISPPVLRLWLNKSRANEPTVSLACWYLHPLRGWESKTTPPPSSHSSATRGFCPAEEVSSRQMDFYYRYLFASFTPLQTEREYNLYINKIIFII